MKCAICGETTEQGKITTILERGATMVVFRGVPASVCPQCGEEWIDDEIAADLEAVFEKQTEAGVQVEVREFAAAA